MKPIKVAVTLTDRNNYDPYFDQIEKYYIYQPTKSKAEFIEKCEIEKDHSLDEKRFDTIYKQLNEYNYLICTGIGNTQKLN